MDTEELVAYGRSQGYTDEEIKTRLASAGVTWTPPWHPPKVRPDAPVADAGTPQSQYPGADRFGEMRTTDQDAPLGAFGEMMSGATAGLSDLGPSAGNEQFKKDNPVGAPLANLAGMAITAPLLPFKAGMLARGMTGGGVAGITAATQAEGSLTDRLKAAKVPAAVGAGAGLVLPPLVGKAGGLVKRAVQPFRSPAKHVSAGAGPLLPKDAEAIMARQEALAPGTATPVSISPGMASSTRVIGANPAVARAAQEAAEVRVTKLQEALNGLSDKYKSLLNNKRAPLDLGEKVNIRSIIVKNGMWPGDETIELQTVQGLRNTLRGKMDALRVAVKEGKGGGPRLHEMGEQFKTLTNWLKKNAPAIEHLDKDYGILARARRAEEKVIKNVAQSRAAYASSRVAGIEPGSPGASLPSKSNFLSRMFSPDRSKLAEEADRLLLQPGQIPPELLRARMRSMQPRRGGLLGSFVLGSQTPSAMSLFD